MIDGPRRWVAARKWWLIAGGAVVTASFVAGVLASKKIGDREIILRLKED